MHFRELPYQENSALLFEPLLSLQWPIFLDSCHPYTQNGRYDILSANPWKTITAWGSKVIVESADSKKIIEGQSPFLILKEELTTLTPTLSRQRERELPFEGGALGYFGYDLAWQLETLPNKNTPDISMPDMAVGFYDWVMVVDHYLKTTWLIDPLSRWRERAGVRVAERFGLLSPFHSNMTFEDYAQAFHKIKNHLTEGDCYQVNLAQRFSATYEGDPWNAYQTLRQVNPGAFSAFFKTPWGSLLSLSPERFLKVDNGSVLTSPIKGTRPRSANPQELLESKKDRAENLMIVDLLRNDLGKSCEYNSVKVPQLFALESLKTVHHLVSHVTGRLKDDQTAIDLLQNCFPGGSITGAPKIRAMEIIERLEPHKRSVYTGSIGYIDANGNMDTNIAIRSLICSEDKVYCWAGGGIVMDSEVEAEYRETFHKVSPILQTLEKMFGPVKSLLC